MFWRHGVWMLRGSSQWCCRVPRLASKRRPAGTGVATWRAPVRRGHAGRACLERLFAAERTSDERGEAADRCSPAAEELSALGIDRAHADPKPLRATSIQRRRIGGLAYERVTFEHDPVLPKTLAVEGRVARRGGGARVPAPRRPQALAGVGTWRGSGRRGRLGAVSNRPTASSPGGSTSRCRCSPATVAGAANGRPIRIWIDSAMWRA